MPVVVKKSLKSFFAAFICVMLLSVTVLGGCRPETDPSKFSAADFLKVEDGIVVNANGDAVMLRGTNAGGYLLIEAWMTAFQASKNSPSLTHKVIGEIFTNRFGKEKAVELWGYYRDNFWTEQDFKNCADMGMSVIRLPFSYMNCDPEFNNVPEIAGQKFNLSVLDWFVKTGAKYGIYTILDMHGAYGSQSGMDHSGERLDLEDVDFYYNEEKQNKTIELWAAIAKHFKGNPAVAAYDILNEPGERKANTEKRHWDFFDKAYKAIRAEDPEHMVMFESCWSGENLPQPSQYGWTNCIYQFHNYATNSAGAPSLTAAVNFNSMQRKITGAESQNFGVPNYMGEFSCYQLEDSWREVLGLFNDSGWHWTNWTYKLNYSTTNNGRPGFGIYFSKSALVTPDVDSFETIKEKWSKINTSDRDAFAYEFASGNTLFNVIRDACLNEYFSGI